MKFDFIVIGAGIIGMSTARELALRGAQVAIFDKGKLGGESSWAAGGILSSMRPWLENPASAELSEQGKLIYPSFTSTLLSETGIDSEYMKSGVIILESKHVAEINRWAKSKCIVVNQPIKQDIANISLQENAVLLPEISQLRPPRLLKALHQSLKQLSVSIYENTNVTKLVANRDCFECVEFNGHQLFAGSLVITAGAWSKSLLANITNEIDTKPVHGQMICLKANEQTFTNMILDGGYYLIPRKDGHVLIGSTIEDIGFKKQTTLAAKKTLLDWAFSIIPELKRAEFIKHWSGLRPSSGNGKPYIGRLLDYENIFLNTGHFRKGILQAPASATLIADSIYEKPSFMDIGQFKIEPNVDESKLLIN